VAIYRRHAHLWSLTERGRDRLRQTPDTLTIGPSSVSWRGDALIFEICEITVPFPTRIVGTVSVHPSAVNARSFDLDADGRHHWWPIAPFARVEVRLERPALRWSGVGYLDSNFGNEPLEAAFVKWHWSRATVGDGTFILFDVTPNTGGDRSLALQVDRQGQIDEREPLPRKKLPVTRWLLPRATRADAAISPTILKTLEDAPFYARSTVASQLWREPVTMIHESLSLARFRNPLIALMLPFRMPRAWR